MTLFFDTETNGLPKDYKGKATNLDNWPRVIQLAWLLYDDNGNFVEGSCELIKPDGWEIPKEKFWIDNGYSTEQSMKDGAPARPIFQRFVEAINRADAMVAHNLQFDYPIMVAEMIRYGLTAERKPAKFCTMKATTDILRLPGRFGFKWPNLQELHRFCFNEDFDGAHDALADVSATARCFFWLRAEYNHLFKIQSPIQ